MEKMNLASGVHLKDEVVPSGTGALSSRFDSFWLRKKIQLASNPGPFLHKGGENEPASFPDFPTVQFFMLNVNKYRGNDMRYHPGY